jgi:hypothetical protein
MSVNPAVATSLPTYPPVDLGALTSHELTALGDYFTTAAATVAAEQTRRRERDDRARRAAAFRLIHEGGDDPRWAPQMWDGARISGGDHSGRRGFIAGACDDGCHTPGGPATFRLLVTAGGPLITCIPRPGLRPVPTVRRPGDGRPRCDYPCRCCMGVPAAAR